MTKKGGLVRDLGIGAAVGYGASAAMDVATGWYWERQKKASKLREDEIAPGGAPVLAGRKLAGWVGRKVTDEEAGRIGFVVHRSLGVTYGVAAAALVRSGMGPARAGMAAGQPRFCWWTRASSAPSSPRRRGPTPSKATCAEPSGTSPTGPPPEPCSPPRAGSGR